ncbi:hypothetical protein ID866_4286 [Astraeus odoratus]|nr:hypothetical protein ID866_4286 [Astraeus odoratus]
MAAAAVSLACPLRRSSRLAHAHAHASHNHSPAPLRQPHHLKHHRHHPTRPPPPDPEPDPDSSSSDPENELTPRALRALKRQRLALDHDGLPIPSRPRPRKRRKENIAHVSIDPISTKKDLAQHLKRPSSPPSLPLTLKRAQGIDSTPSSDNVAHIPSSFISELSVDLSNDTGPSIPMSSTDVRPPSASFPRPLLSDAFTDEPSILMCTDDSDPAPSSRSTHLKANQLSILPVPPPIATDLLSPPSTSPPHGSSTASSPESSPLTPLTPLTPSPSPSPLCQDRHKSPSPPPLSESLPPPISIDVAPLPPDNILPISTQQLASLPIEQTLPPPSSPLAHPSPLSLESALENLIPFDTLTPAFGSEMAVQLNAHHEDTSGSQPHPHGQAPELQEHYPHPSQQLPNSQRMQYMAPQPQPMVGRDREVNIWKLACQERVEYLYRRYGVETIKAVVASEARLPSSVLRSTSSSPTQPPQTRFRLYTPASYTWGSGSTISSGTGSKKGPLDDINQSGEGDGEAEWVGAEGDIDVDGDMDVDMEDDDDDYEDDDELAEGEGDADGEGDVALDAEMEGLNVNSGTGVQGLGENLKEVHGKGEVMMMNVDCGAHVQAGMIDQADKENNASASTVPSDSSTSQSTASPSLLALSDTLPASANVAPMSLLAMTIPPAAFTPPLRPQLPLLSSLHVPILSEPPRAFMGRGTPPDRRRLVEWSVSGRYPGCQTESIGVGLYLTTSQTTETVMRHPNTGDEGSLGIVASMPIIHPPDHIHECTNEHVHQLQTEHRHQPQPHQHAGEWTSFLYAMLEGDGMNVCLTGSDMSSATGSGSPTPGSVGVSAVTGTGQTTDASGWYELGLSSVHMGGVVPGVSGDMSLSHHHHSPHVPIPPMDHAPDDANSSTLRFALG